MTPTSSSARGVGGGSRWSSGPRGRGRPATSPGRPGGGSAGRSAGDAARADAVVAISPARPGRAGRGGYDPARIVDLPNGVPVPGRALAASGPTPIRSAPRSSAGWPPRRGSMPWSTPGRSSWPGRPGARLTLIGEGPGAAAARSAGSPGSAWAGRSSCRAPRPTRRPILRDVRPVRPPLARGGDEHRPAGGDGPGHPRGRLGDPRQPRPDDRRRPRPARPARRPPRPGPGDPRPPGRPRRPERWPRPPAAGWSSITRSPPSPAGTWSCSRRLVAGADGWGNLPGRATTSGSPPRRSPEESADGPIC